MNLKASIRLHDLTNLQRGIASLVDDIQTAIDNVEDGEKVLNTLATLRMELQENIDFVNGVMMDTIFDD